MARSGGEHASERVAQQCQREIVREWWCQTAVRVGPAALIRTSVPHSYTVGVNRSLAAVQTSVSEKKGSDLSFLLWRYACSIGATGGEEIVDAALFARLLPPKEQPGV